ncbi:MAG: allophanate hydrolase [Pseudomonadota bacterium]
MNNGIGAGLPLTLSALRTAYEKGTSPQETIRAVYARIRAVNDPGIFIHLIDEVDSLTAADTLGAFDPERPLWGVPFVVKDNIDVAGCPTTAGCPSFAYDAATDAHAVARLRAAGAIPIGKTNLDQFATGLVGVRSPYPIPKNAIDPEIVPGGSSSGSAVAVAHGIVPFSLGTDTAGSGRVPAALNNIVGLKPTLGALSSAGVVPACRTLDTISIFALTVDDAHAVYRVANGYLEADPYSKPVVAPPLSAIPSGLRIGVPTLATRIFEGDAAQKASFATALERCADMGHTIVDVDFEPLYAVARMLYEGAWVAERHAVVESMLKAKADAVHPTTRAIIEPAADLSATDAFRGIYRLAELKRQVEPILAGVDMLCVPTIPTFASVADLEADPIGPNSMFGTYTNFVNLLDMCGIAVPVAARCDGRPGSVTLLATAGKDGAIASLARHLEQVEGRGLGATSAPVPALGDIAPLPVEGEMSIAVCGAHMSGLPLNHQLTDRGGRFLRSTRSAPLYGFHALAGGPPHRPGMVRDLDAGGAIALEIWALPEAHMGSFLAGIPSPLGLGTVQLEDGDTVIGFVCESAGLEGAEDITALGDWRSYMAKKATPAAAD